MRDMIVIPAALLLVSGIFAGCGASPEDVAELKNQQKQVLAKLADIEKKLDARPAAPAAARPSGPDADKVHTLPVGKSAVRGPANAAVSIVEFSDYQCPFCSRSEPLIKEVLQQYPTQVNFVYKHFPLTSIHPQAMGAAQAAVAAGKQGKFWEMHDLLFAHQRELAPEKLKEYAQQLGLDTAKFEADMNSAETKAVIQEDMQLAQQVQVRGTPTIFVAGKLLQNRSVEGFKQIIDGILKDKPPAAS